MCTLERSVAFSNAAVMYCFCRHCCCYNNNTGPQKHLFWPQRLHLAMCAQTIDERCFFYLCAPTSFVSPDAALVFCSDTRTLDEAWMTTYETILCKPASRALAVFQGNFLPTCETSWCKQPHGHGPMHATHRTTHAT